MCQHNVTRKITVTCIWKVKKAAQVFSYPSTIVINIKQIITIGTTYIFGVQWWLKFLEYKDNNGLLKYNHFHLSCLFIFFQEFRPIHTGQFLPVRLADQYSKYTSGFAQDIEYNRYSGLLMSCRIMYCCSCHFGRKYLLIIRS